MRGTVAVVGAGIAGLTAGYELQKAGHRVVVFERSGWAGGRMSMTDVGPLRVTTGAHELFSFYHDMRELIREVGLEARTVDMTNHYTFMTVTPQHSHVFDPTRSLARLMTSPALSPRSKARLGGLWADAREAKRTTDPNLVHTAARYDDESLATYLTRRVGPDLLEGVVEPFFRCLWGWEPEEISKAYFLSLAGWMGRPFELFNFRDGIGELTAELARRLDVRLEHEVTGIAPRPEGGRTVRFTSAEGAGELTVDAVVLACYADTIPAIVPDLRDDELAFLRQVRYTQYGVLYCVQKAGRHPAPRRDIFSRAHPSPFSLLVARRGDPAAGTPPLIYGALSPEQVVAMQESGLTLEGFAMPHMRAAYPDIDATTDQIHTQWWERELPYFYPGYVRALARFIDRQAAEPRPDLVFCGDYLAHATTGGACASGRQAARDLDSRLRERVTPPAR